MPSRKFVIVVLCGLALAVGTTRSNPIPAIPRPDPVPRSSDRAQVAGRLFWETFHGNDYCKVDAVIAELTAAYEASPEDRILPGLLAGAHAWKALEHRRACRSAAELRDHAVLSMCLFERGARLNPDNRLLPGLAEGMRAAVGVLDGNKPLVEQAFANIRRNTKIDPNVHGFVQGWVFSPLLDDSDSRYPEAIQGYFAAMDSCAGIRVPRAFPYVPRLAMLWLEIRGRKDTVCYNTDVSPHNLEGTLLGLGDAYLKQGKLTRARLVYESIKNCPSYATWSYKDRLAVRLENPEKMRDKFRADSGKLDVAEPAMFFQSSFACTGCHAR
jgi:hypothetical protein